MGGASSSGTPTDAARTSRGDEQTADYARLAKWQFRADAPQEPTAYWHGCRLRR